MTPRRIRWSEIKHHWGIYLFIVPTFALIALFQCYPMASGLIHSFFRWNGSDIFEWVGWQNYRELLARQEFRASVKLALALGAWNVIKLIPALLIAVCIHRCRSERLQFLYRTLFLIPAVIPGLVILLIWRSFFFETTTGYLNQFLHASGLMDLLIWTDGKMGWGGLFAIGRSPAWLGDPHLIIASCIVWGLPWVGAFALLTQLAKLRNIDQEIYEAGAIDGVNWWTKFTRIELPMIMDSIHLLLVFVIIDTIKDTGMIMALAGVQGGPGGVATVPALFMIQKAFLDQDMGFACAAGIVLALGVLLLQKLSALFLNGSGPGLATRSAARIAALIGGYLCIARVSMPLPGALLIAFGIPWGALAGVVGTLFAPLRGAGSSGDRYVQRQKAREQSVEYHRMRWIGSRLLRALKHATIWGVLACAFLPLYLMLVVSVKSNAQVYASPATLSGPIHWENWKCAWDVVAPNIANSLFVACSSTLFTLLFALGGAYFFARYRMPLAKVLWNAILVLMIMPAMANLVPLFSLLRDLNLLNTLTALIVVGVSSGQIFAIFTLRQFVADIPQDLFAAAETDGASHVQQIRNIVLPLCGPILGAVGVMHFLSCWNDFVFPLIVMRDQANLPVMVQLIRMAGEYIKRWGPLMAGYAIASIPVILLFICAMKLFIKGVTEGAVKG